MPNLNLCSSEIQGSRQPCCPTSNTSTYGYQDPPWFYCNATTQQQTEQMDSCLEDINDTNRTTQPKHMDAILVDLELERERGVDRGGKIGRRLGRRMSESARGVGI